MLYVSFHFISFPSFLFCCCHSSPRHWSLPNAPAILCCFLLFYVNFIICPSFPFCCASALALFVPVKNIWSGGDETKKENRPAAQEPSRLGCSTEWMVEQAIDDFDTNCGKWIPLSFEWHFMAQIDMKSLPLIPHCIIVGNTLSLPLIHTHTHWQTPPHRLIISGKTP